MKRRGRIHLLTGALLGGCAAVLAAPLSAQCADGTPPPCEVRARQVAARGVPPPNADERSRRFLVLPFRNITRAPGHEWLVEGSPTLLADALDEWREVSVVPSRQLSAALRRYGLVAGQSMEEAQVRRVAEETGGWTVVEGDVLAVASRIRIRAQSYDAVTGKPVASATVDVPSEAEIFGAYEQIAARLLEPAGLRAAPELARAATQSLEAYRAYLRGITHDDRSEFEQARAAFLEAARIDSAFGQAWARAAETSVMTFELLTDPNYPGRRYAARAAALTAGMPERDRRLIEGLNAFYNGQFGAAREIFEQLVAADSSDLDALKWLAHLEAWDFILDPQTQLPRGSLNRAARLAKRGLALDPTRHRFYPILLFSYSVAAGIWGGMMPGFLQERASPRAMFMRFPDRAFVALMRDTIELVPLQVFVTLPADSVRAARRRGIETTRAWVDRWLAAGPGEAEAHFWASRLEELDGHFEAALAALKRADSLGMESRWDDRTARRMILLGKLGRYQGAVRMADSLMDAGYFTNTAEFFGPGGFERPGWALLLFLHDQRFERAEATLAPFLAAVRPVFGPMFDQIAPAMVCGEGVAAGLSPVDLPHAFRREVARRALAYAPRMPSSGFVPLCVASLLELGAATEGPEGAEFLGAARQALAAAVDSGNATFAVTMATTLANSDTTTEGRLAVLGTMRRIVARDSANVLAHYQIGKIGALTGRELDVAQASLERYLSHQPPPGAPTHADAHWRLGLIHEHRRAPERARAAYQEALKLNPAHPQAREALARLGGQPR